MADSTRSEGKGGRIPLLPLRDIVVFPHMVVPLFVGRPKSIQALEDAMAADRRLVVAAQRVAGEEDPTPEDIYSIGTLGTIIQLLRLPDGTVKVLVEGRARAEIRRFAAVEPYFAVEINELRDESNDTPEAQALVRSVQATFDSYSKLNKKVAPEIVNSVAAISDPGKLADTVVAHLNLKLPDRQKLLEIISSAERLEEVFSRMQAEIEVLEVERKIRGRVKKQMERSQKEYYLNEQMRAIQKELGERDDPKNELSELEEQLSAKKMPQEAREKDREGDQEAEADAADGGRSDGGPELHRLDARPALERVQAGREGSQGLGGDPRLGPLRAREAQGAHPRVPRGADPRREAEGADPLSRRAARRRQDLARQVDRPRDGT
jgi:ATP-dependent Lon protease